jgi:molybdopterin-containing oxidoreductase family membrane subunit
MFLFPKTRENFLTLNMSCIFIIIGVYIEKGLGLVVPGFVPDTLGEIYEYAPTKHEVLVAVGIWATGALIYTILLKFAIPIYTGKLRFGVTKEGVPARDIMTKKLVTVTPEVTIEEVSKLLTSRHISAVPVVDKDNKVIGVVSESDIISNVIRHEPDFTEKSGNHLSDTKGDKHPAAVGTTAADIMTSPPVTAFKETTLQELNQIIMQKKIRRVIIVDGNGHPIGIISRGDIMKMLGKYLER